MKRPGRRTRGSRPPRAFARLEMTSTLSLGSPELETEGPGRTPTRRPSTRCPRVRPCSWSARAPTRAAGSCSTSTYVTGRPATPDTQSSSTTSRCRGGTRSSSASARAYAVKDVGSLNGNLRQPQAASTRPSSPAATRCRSASTGSSTSPAPWAVARELGRPPPARTSASARSSPSAGRSSPTSPSPRSASSSSRVVWSSPQRTASGYRNSGTTEIERLRYVLAAQRDRYHSRSA